MQTCRERDTERDRERGLDRQRLADKEIQRQTRGGRGGGGGGERGDGGGERGMEGGRGGWRGGGGHVGDVWEDDHPFVQSSKQGRVATTYTLTPCGRGGPGFGQIVH